MLGDDGIPGEVRVVPHLTYHPWQTTRSGLLIMGMDPQTDLQKVSSFIQDRTTWWEVAVCLADSIRAYEPALLAQGAIKVIPHPEDDLTGCRNEIRELLSILSTSSTEMLGLELADLIQLYGEKRLARTIRVSGEGVIGSIFFRNGNIVHAETMDEDEGMVAFQRIFAVRAPELRVHSGCLTTKSTLNMPALSVLLEGARVHDEGERDSQVLLPGDSAPHEPGSNIATAPTQPISSGDINAALDDIIDDFDFGSQADDEIPEKMSVPSPAGDLDSELDVDDLDDLDSIGD